MNVPYAAVVYGLGGGWLDPATGEKQLVARLKAIGFETGGSPYNYYDSQPIYDFLSPHPAAFRLIIGDSLGACNAPQFASMFKSIDYIAGFQPRWYGAHIPVPANVKRAHCIYDPDWIDTGGLGAYEWVLAQGNTATKLLVTQHRGAHPDDYGPMQDLIFAEVKQLIGA
jgi:hypothetical protein